MKNILDLRPGDRAVVNELIECEFSIKLMEMGMFPGAEIEYSYHAPFGDPICIKLGNQWLSIRKKDAKNIPVCKVNGRS